MRYQLSFTSMYLCKQTNNHHRTDLLQIAGLLESPATCNDTLQDKSGVERASWLSIILLWPVAYYIFLRTFHLSLSSFSPLPQQQFMAPWTTQPGVITPESCRTMGASSNASLAETQQQRRHHSVHCDAEIAATKNMALDTHLKKVH